MFTVPGWSISAKDLKGEKIAGEQSSKKRKRSTKEHEIVDSSRIGELWSQHIEGKGKETKLQSSSSSKRERKRSKLEAAVQGTTAEQGSAEIVDRTSVSPSQATAGKGKIQSNKHKDEAIGNRIEEPTKSGEPVTVQHNTGKAKKKRKKKSTGDDGPVVEQPEPKSKDVAHTQPQSQTQIPSKLTPLQARMRQKLISSRFRHLNETLYANPSSFSLDLFTTKPEFFSEYHEGFRRQVDAWPENPMDSFLRWIRERGPVGLRNYKDIRRKTSRKPIANDQTNDEDLPSGPESLPRDPRKGICTIVDLGCGDGRLGSEITNSSLEKKLRLKVHSYDLASSAPHITVADIKSLPLDDSSVDVAIFSLALMGTNWIEFIEEAYHVLRWKGECWIAEVASRFAGPRSKRVEHSVGNRTKGKLKASGKQDHSKLADEEAEDLGLVADANDAPPQSTTDVSAFLEVMRRRGFVLQGEPQTSNKMFVLMRFIKAANPRQGKCVKQERKGEKKRFIEDNEDSITVEEEAKVLKPCVYKLR